MEQFNEVAFTFSGTIAYINKVFDMKPFVPLFQRSMPIGEPIKRVLLDIFEPCLPAF